MAEGSDLSGIAHLAHHRRNIDDPPFAVFAHDLGGFTVQTKATLWIDSQDLVEILVLQRTRKPSLVMPALTSTAKSTLSLISAAKKSATAALSTLRRRHGPASSRRDFGHGLFRLFGAAHIGEKNLKAVAGKGLGDGPADAARTAGHQGRGERLCGGRTLCSCWFCLCCENVECCL